MTDLLKKVNFCQSCQIMDSRDASASKNPCDRLVSVTDCIRLVAILQRKHLRLGVIGLTLRLVLSQVPDSDVLDY